jgi:hypothetical protein
MSPTSVILLGPRDEAPHDASVPRLEVPQPADPPTPAVPDVPVSPAVPDPGTPAAPEEPSTVPAPEEPATPVVPEPTPGDE